MQKSSFCFVIVIRGGSVDVEFNHGKLFVVNCLFVFVCRMCMSVLTVFFLIRSPRFQLLRVESAEGTRRVEVVGSDSTMDLFEKVIDFIVLDDPYFAFY